MRASHVVVLVGALGAAAGCAAIYGIEDASLDPEHDGGISRVDAGGEGDASTTGDAAPDAQGPEIPETCAQAEQSPSYVGCEFWPTVTPNAVWSVFDFAAVVANPGKEAADVEVTDPAGAPQKVTVQPGQLAKIYLPWVRALKGDDSDNCGTIPALTSSVLVSKGAFKLTSTRPVAVYQFNALEYKGVGGPAGKSWSTCPGVQGCALANDASIGCFSFSNDASLLFPTAALGTSYRVLGYSGLSPSGIFGGTEFSPFLVLTGTRDGTTVTVTLKNGAMYGGTGVDPQPAGATFTLRLDAGSVARLVGNKGATADFSGARITSTAPIQVVSGLPCRLFPDNTPACDHVEESVAPAESLGKRYVVALPTGPSGNTPGHVVRFYGNENGTQLTYTPSRPPSCPITLNAGDIVDCGHVTIDFEVTADKSFAVGSYLLGAGLADPDGGGEAQRGDPSQSHVVPVEQYRSRYVFLAPDDYDLAYADIVAPSGTTFLLDGETVTPTLSPIGANGYGVARVKLGRGQNGAHILNASQRVGVQIVGYGRYTSYYFPGGTNLARIAAPPSP